MDGTLDSCSLFSYMTVSVYLAYIIAVLGLYVPARNLPYMSTCTPTTLARRP
jgi:hypothetical protein